MEPSPFSKKTRFALLDQIFNDWLQPYEKDAEEMIQLKRKLEAYERAVREVMYREFLLKMLTISHEITEDVFLTVNPPANISIERLRNTVEEFVSWSDVKRYLYAFEATGNADRAPHVHIVFHHGLSTYKWGLLLKRMHTLFGKIVDTGIKTLFDVRHIIPEDVANVVKYIMKTQPPKNGQEREKDRQTNQLREQNGLDDYYSNIEGAAIQGLIEN